MPQIRPVSDLRNNFAEISRIVHDCSEPIFLTKNGYGDMVVMSVDLYEKLGIAQALISQQPQHTQQSQHIQHTQNTESDLKIQKPLSKWQKTLSNLVSNS